MIFHKLDNYLIILILCAGAGLACAGLSCATQNPPRQVATATLDNTRNVMTVASYLEKLHGGRESPKATGADLLLQMRSLPRGDFLEALKSWKGNINDSGAAEVLNIAAGSGDMEIVCALLRRGVQLKNNIQIRGVFHIAAAAGQLPVMEELCKYNKYGFLEADPRGWTPLHFAIVFGHHDLAAWLAKRLHEYREDSFVRERMPFITFSAKTPLHFSEMLHFSDISEILVACGFSRRTPDARGWTPDDYKRYSSKDYFIDNNNNIENIDNIYNNMDAESARKILKFADSFRLEAAPSRSKAVVCLGPPDAGLFINNFEDPALPESLLLQIEPGGNSRGFNLPFVLLSKDGTVNFAIYQNGAVRTAIGAHLRDMTAFQDELYELNLASIGSSLNNDILTIQFGAWSRPGRSRFKFHSRGSVSFAESAMPGARDATAIDGAEWSEQLSARAALRILLLYIQFLPQMID